MGERESTSHGTVRFWVPERREGGEGEETAIVGVGGRKIAAARLRVGWGEVRCASEKPRGREK
jgi:hypothetical protein